jgi:hypothetical protein
MGLEIQKKRDGSLRSNWWYGRFEVNGVSKCMNLGVEIKGCPPETLRMIGDPQFERSRAQAQVKLDGLIHEAKSQKAAEKHLQELYELKAGESLCSASLLELESIWDHLPVKKPRSEQWVKAQHEDLKRFRVFVTGRNPQISTLSQVTRAVALAWMQSKSRGSLVKPITTS